MRAIPTLLLLICWPAGLPALSLDCTARQACVTTMGACQQTEVGYRLDAEDKVGAKVVLTTDEQKKSYEFRRLVPAEGLRLQAAGGALDPHQGAGVLTIFDDLSFVLTRHQMLYLDGEGQPGSALAISILGRCEERE
jgi:hypothetical protein